MELGAHGQAREFSSLLGCSSSGGCFPLALNPSTRTTSMSPDRMLKTTWSLRQERVLLPLCECGYPRGPPHRLGALSVARQLCTSFRGPG